MLGVQNKLNSPGNVCDTLSITAENNFDSPFVKTNKNGVYRNALTMGANGKGLRSRNVKLTFMLKHFVFKYLMFLCRNVLFEV